MTDDTGPTATGPIVNTLCEECKSTLDGLRCDNVLCFRYRPKDGESIAMKTRGDDLPSIQYIKFETEVGTEVGSALSSDTVGPADINQATYALVIDALQPLSNDEARKVLSAAQVYLDLRE